MTKNPVPVSHPWEDKSLGLQSMPLAMAYVPIQRFRNVTTPEKGLRQGSIFNDLVKPLEYGLKRRPER